MTPEQFCYWLQGCLELRGTDEPLSREQMAMVRAHLDTVFCKVTRIAASQQEKPSEGAIRLEPPAPTTAPQPAIRPRSWPYGWPLLIC